MTIKIGLNIHNALQASDGQPRAYSADEKRKRDAIVDRLQSTGNLFMDDIDAARACKKRHPNMIVVHRAWRGDDGTLYESRTPKQFYDEYAKFAEGGIVIQVMNEPTGYGKQGSSQDLEKIAAWCAEVMDLFGAAGLSLALPNFGEGHPDDKRLSELAALWEALKKWKDLHYFASHEYGTWRGMTFDDLEDKADVSPWRVGRFTFVANYCQSHYGFIPNMLITEWGIDSAHDGLAFRGWRTTSRTAREYAQELIRCVREKYNFPYVKALMIYCLGNTGRRHTEFDWWSFDVWDADEFFDELEAESKTVPAPLPIPTSVPYPLDTHHGWERGRAAHPSGGRTNVREQPLTTAKTLFQIPPEGHGDVLFDTSASKEMPDGLWFPIQILLDSQRIRGWVRIDVIQFTPHVIEPPPPVITRPQIVLEFAPEVIEHDLATLATALGIVLGDQITSVFVRRE